MSQGGAAGFISHGGNYSVSVDREVVHCRVWKRPELTREQGAAFAVELQAILESLAREAGVRALILDLSRVAPGWGPITQRALETALGAWAEAERPVAVVAGHAPSQVVVLDRLVVAAGGPKARVVGDLGGAWRHVGGG